MENGHMENSHYRRLALMAALSFAFMYVLMYAMVDVLGNVYNSLNQFYMAGLMTAPMVAIEVLLMAAMYHRKRLNVLILAGSTLALVGFFLLIRQQTAIGDRQFLRSMIPHHASAMLMCHEASLEDPEIRTLCDSIKASQQAEIDQMKRILDRMDP
jgi:uncharacterized protein (DUF305 family)